MKLLRFNTDRIGLARGDEVVDMTELVQPEGIAAWPPVGVLRLIRDFARLSALAFEPGRPRLWLGDLHLEAPLIWPNKLLAFPVNYVAHGAEMKSANRADLNGFFMKAPTSISGPNDPIRLPDLPGREIHHECELGVVIGRAGKNIARETAMEHVFGYTCLVDVVLRGREERVMRKSYDSFCPIGPWIVTADEIADPAAIEMALWIDGEERQRANTRDLIVDIPGMIALASRVATLHPGDLIASGTPEGVGPIIAGNVLRIAIAGVGEMSLAVQ